MLLLGVIPIHLNILFSYSYYYVRKTESSIEEGQAGKSESVPAAKERNALAID